MAVPAFPSTRSHHRSLFPFPTPSRTFRRERSAADLSLAHAIACSAPSPLYVLRRQLRRSLLARCTSTCHGERFPQIACGVCLLEVFLFLGSEVSLAISWSFFGEKLKAVFLKLPNAGCENVEWRIFVYICSACAECAVFRTYRFLHAVRACLNWLPGEEAEAFVITFRATIASRRALWNCVRAEFGWQLLVWEQFDARGHSRPLLESGALSNAM